VLVVLLQNVQDHAVWRSELRIRLEVEVDHRRKMQPDNDRATECSQQRNVKLTLAACSNMNRAGRCGQKSRLASESGIVDAALCSMAQLTRENACQQLK
jgi:hypothetical protein